MDHSTRIEISGSMNLEDFVSAFRWFIMRRRRAYLIVCWLLIGSGLVMLIEVSLGSRRPTEWILVGILTAIVVAFAVAAPRLTSRRLAKQQYSSTPGIALPTTYVFDREGVSSVNAEASSRQSWATYYEVHETDPNFILLRSRALMHILPKRYFRDELQIAEFRALVRDRLGDRAKMKFER